MCLAVLALMQHPRYAVVLVSNRDEFHARPTAPLQRWLLPKGGEVYGGRDLQAGGAWLACTAAGRVGLLTNVRRPDLPTGGPSRGALVASWLAADSPAVEPFWAQACRAGHAPFNLLLRDERKARWFWGSNAGLLDGHAAETRWLPHTGVFGLCNAALDTPWPKLMHLKQQVHTTLTQAQAPASESAEHLASRLWPLLADAQRFPDEALPDTGVGLPLERLLSSVFIRDERGVYGTRSSSVLLLEHAQPGHAGRLHFFERRFDAAGTLLGTSALTLPS